MSASQRFVAREGDDPALDFLTIIENMEYKTKRLKKSELPKVTDIALFSLPGNGSLQCVKFRRGHHAMIISNRRLVVMFGSIVPDWIFLARGRVLVRNHPDKKGDNGRESSVKSIIEYFS